MMLRSALAFLLTQTHGQSNCPDQDLQAKCEGICGQNYFECTGLCNGDHNCELLCLNDLPICALDCPCAVNCPNGCDGCPNEGNDFINILTIISEKYAHATSLNSTVHFTKLVCLKQARCSTGVSWDVP